MAKMNLSLLFLMVMACVAYNATAHGPLHRDEWVLAGEGLERTDPVPGSLLVSPIRVSLRQRNMTGLEARLLSVSNPRSAAYNSATRHLTIEKVREMTAARPEHVDAAMRWISSHKATGGRSVSVRLSVTGDDLVLEDADAEWVQRALNVSLFRFRPRSQQHGSNRLELVRSVTCPSIPDSLLSAVELIYGVCEFPSYHHSAFSQRIRNEPGETITPAVLKDLYQIQSTAFGENTTKQSSQSVAEFEEAYFFPSDVATFERKYDLPVKPVARIVGKNEPTEGYLGEASLDTQYATAVAPGLPLWVFSHYTFDLFAWAETIMNTTDAPMTHSISWGSAEDKIGTTLVERWNGEFIKLGSLGHTVLAASGDSGSQNSGMFRCKTLRVQFPASSPYVTVVGGTIVRINVHDDRVGDEAYKETAWSSSGGGFSNVFARPAYQDGKVDHYLSTYSSQLPDTKHFNSKGRAVPDVGGAATNYQVVVQGFWGNVSGTSASTPVWAGLVAELNHRRKKAGLPSLGFLNPWLYSLPLVGQDIISGNNRVWPCKAGFASTPGWDAITGLGTPNHAFLIRQLELHFHTNTNASHPA